MDNEIDFSKIDNIEMEGIDYGDVPDFCDAFIANCDIDGQAATDEELDFINEDGSFVYDSLMNYLY